ncbi:MAG TPA: HDIG domain-containing protein [Bacteroidetes bacterium]|nr:HDIG domain-containing protein [Bacteroidota bacterium]
MRNILSKLQQYYYEIIKVFLFLIAIAIVIWVSPKESFFRYEFQLGKPWSHNDLIAPFDFPILKTEKQMEEERKQLLDNFVPYFRYYDDLAKNKKNDFNKLFSEQWIMHLGNNRQKDSIKYARIAKKIYDQIEEKGVVRYDPVLDGKTSTSKINLIKGNEVTKTDLGKLFSVRTANDYIQNKLKGFDGEDSAFLSNVLTRSLVQNVIYDEKRSKDGMKELLSHIMRVQGLIQRGELIISTGEVVTPKKYQILSSLKSEYEQELGTSEARRMIISGMILLITLLFVIQFLFLFIYKRRFYDSVKNILIILMTQILLIVITHFIFGNFPQWTYMIPFAILPIVIVAFLDAGIAIIVHLITVLILGFYAPNSFVFFYTQFTAGLMAVFAVQKLSKRSDLFRASLVVFLTYMAVYVSMLLLQEGSLESFSWDMTSYLAGSSILLLLAFPIIFVYEKLFGVLTNLSLLELSNTNNPLLRDLSIKAPGTFQHSLQVSNLASEALHAIGGDALLARTGALYHDIGKMGNPLYFIENQSAGYNPHDELTFEESARIIISHVIKGIEMARKARLPEPIIDFIRTHHGTRRVEYFYRLEKKVNPGMEVDQSEFLYHGPIPFSRETAVVMMADSVEAASRSINEPDEQKINDLVDNIVESLMKDNQLINADISLKEINIVKKVLKKKMLNIHHVRIAYPD